MDLFDRCSGGLLHFLAGVVAAAMAITIVAMIVSGCSGAQLREAAIDAAECTALRAAEEARRQGREPLALKLEAVAAQEQETR